MCIVYQYIGQFVACGFFIALGINTTYCLATNDWCSPNTYNNYTIRHKYTTTIRTRQTHKHHT